MNVLFLEISEMITKTFILQREIERKRKKGIMTLKFHILKTMLKHILPFSAKDTETHIPLQNYGDLSSHLSGLHAFPAKNLY